MSRPIGDECYVCPSCMGGTYVVRVGFWTPALSDAERAAGVMPTYLPMDLCECEDCGGVFAVADSTIPDA